MIRDKREIILDFHGSPDAILNALHQAGWKVVPKEEALPQIEVPPSEVLADGVPLPAVHCGACGAKPGERCSCEP